MTLGILPWALFFGLVLKSLRDAGIGLPGLRRQTAGASFKVAEGLFHELEETLASGLVPTSDRWQKLEALDSPWSTLAYPSLTQLRSEGAAVIPSLKRFRELARRHFESLAEARAKSSQALAQAGVCGALVPIFALVLRVLLPEVRDAGGVWWFVVGAAAVLGLLSGAWILKMVDRARWGGLPASERDWMLAVSIFGERCLALLRLGRAPDRAWTEALPMLPAALIAEWGADPWQLAGAEKKAPENLRQALLGAGGTYKKAIQASLWDGHPCTERIESVLEGLRAEIRAYQEKELALLPTRALQPLFILTAPGILGLLGFALYLSVSSALGEM